MSTVEENTNITAPTDPTVGKETGRESSLSNWAGPYVTDMLGRGQALADQPYEAYSGPLTAGQSELQTQAFEGLAGLAIPTDQMGAYTPQQFTAESAQQYMNPYLMASLNPQLDEARRQAEIQRVQDAGRLTKAGAYGGSRQAIMESEANRNLLQNMSAITGEGYRTAYDTAMGQFNTEQDREMAAQEAANTYGLSALRDIADMGATQRDITSEGIAADKAQFDEEQLFPYKQVQYMQSLLQDLPISAQSYSYMQPSQLSTVLSTAGGLDKLYEMLFK